MSQQTNSQANRNEQKTTVRSRTFCLTSYDIKNYEQWKTLNLTETNIKYFVYQKELCPTTKKEHLQGYIEFKNQMRTYKSIKQILNDPALHIEQRRGTQDEARNYCMKAESQIAPPVELGQFTTQGRRTDIQELYNALKSGKTPTEIMELYPKLYIKYYKAIDRVFNNINQSKEGKFRPVNVEVLYGEAGTGKTRQVYQKEGTENVYRLNQSNSQNLWFDGYTNQKVLLIDDYYGWIKYGTLLQLLDGYHIRLEKKGGFVYSNWTKIYITSNEHPKEWYTKGLTQALSRRINTIAHYELDDQTEISRPIEKYYSVKNGIATDITLNLNTPKKEKSCCPVLPTTNESKNVNDEDATQISIIKSDDPKEQNTAICKKDANLLKKHNQNLKSQFLKSFNIQEEDLFTDEEDDEEDQDRK